MEFHIRRDLREKLSLDDLLFSYTGNVVFANVASSRKLAQQLNVVLKTEDDPERMVNAGALFAMGLIDELTHALIAKYRRELDPKVLQDGLQWLSGRIESEDPQAMERLLLRFTQIFPNVSVFRGEQTASEWLQKATEGMPNREAALEELLLLWLANQNPALKRFQDLFDDSDLREGTAYVRATEGLPEYFSTRPPVAAELGSLLDVLRAPMLASPDSLTGQLDYIRTHWSEVLGADLKRVLLAIDTLREEDLAIWMRFHPAQPDQYRHGAPGRGDEGFVGDEYVGLDEWTTDAEGRRVRRYAAGYQAPLHEYEAFSADQAWMPNVVMMAKSTYVWLEQLSKKYGRHIHRLDQVPDEELALMADRGITALWLIGLWERSVASRTIKHLRGHTDAVASAYSLKDYAIAMDLGGYEAYEQLKQRAASVGIRLASDMVPNHMGIDSPWVIENPDAFLYRWESPYPSYSFNGPDLSTDSRVEIKLEDHYYDQSDAAVVFRIRHHADGATRFMYHGNDGTQFAWNDTAQLDYSKAWVREQVMQAILHVARMFPIIRFDAAMVLAKRHVQRLWFPLPGAGGSIPSRSENAMSQEEFDALMPHEFWREVVDRVAVEVPGTLLLAEAFWLLEGYFVRTLGMHRVYNSAFMNMLRDEENAKYRSYLKKTMEFDPDILKRYVNFMSNPDERTAIDQFGSGDKCFGVATLLATLPGLPMFGHGQIEGYTERYGMEFKQARMDEHPNDSLVARHQAEIAPLLKKRYIFAESANFVLYDFWNGGGSVDENVFAYSNNFHGERSLIVYNNSYDTRQGTIHHSAASMDKGSGQLRQRSLAEGLALPWDDAVFVAYRNRADGLEYLRRANDFHRYGMSFELRGYQYAVLLDWRELRSSEEQPWERLCDSLNGAGVYSVDEALKRLRLRPLYEALLAVLAPGDLQALVASSEEALSPEVLKKAASGQSFLARAGAFMEVAGHYLPGAEIWSDATSEEQLVAALSLPSLKKSLSKAVLAGLQGVLPLAGASVTPWAPVLAWVLLREMNLGEPRVAGFDALGLREALAEAFASAGLEGERAWQAAAKVRLLVTQSAASVTEDAFWSDGDVRWLTGAHEHEGATYVNKELFEELIGWLALPGLVDALQKNEKPVKSESFVAKTLEAMRVAGYNVQAFLKAAQGSGVAAKKSRSTPSTAKPVAKKAAAKTSGKVAAAQSVSVKAVKKIEASVAEEKASLPKVAAKKAAVKKPTTGKAAPKKPGSKDA